MSQLLSVDDALVLVLSHVPPPVEAAGVAELEYAIGAVLFEDVHADGDFPAWPRSRVDGYAVAADATPGSFDVVCEVPAGKPPRDSIARGAAARIFTGGAVPRGADAVAKQEDVRVEAGRVTLAARLAVGTNVTPRASECAAGAVVGARGSVITPGLTGALASVGKATVRVARRPPVVILSTGNELVPVREMPPPGRIRSSNAHSLMAAMWSYGAHPEMLPIAPDERPALDDAIKTALDKDPAIVLITGGVSVGDYDLVPATLADSGAECVFHGVSVQPGKPLWFGTYGSTLVFGLPGNPVSALVDAALFVRPALRKMSGRTDVIPETLTAALGGDLPAGTWRRRYVPARMTSDAAGHLVATPVQFAGSGDVFGYSLADALIVVPESAPGRSTGDRCHVVPLAGTAR